MPENNTFILDKSRIEPLFKPWEMPNTHRIKADGEDGASVAKGRRKSGINIVNNLRAELAEWRDAFYIGASDTSRHLLNYWFEREHRITIGAGEDIDFNYYFCQREAIEALIYLKEVRQIERLSQLVAAFEGENAEFAALGINPEEDLWTKYAFKLATGAGKTKCMSLAIVWSYFHSLRESNSPMAKHFVVIAPNLTVFERLKEDFRPEGGGADIFDNDPLIPPEWRGDWNLTTVLQDEAGGVSTGGTLYLTNIHRLYAKKNQRGGDADTFPWMGPKVSKQKALDTGAALRERIKSHGRIMVLNDEAHHVWDPDNAWSEAIETLHSEMNSSRDTGGVVAQLDFSATPKDNSGRTFRHVVCDTPLGEAVDAGIVKCPIIGVANGLEEIASNDAAYKYEMHLMLGYERWKKSKEEWEKSKKKALLFVMCNNTDEADQITRRLNSDSRFKELNGKTINLHTNLKGKIKNVGSGKNKRPMFIENEKQISDEDLKALRKLSRELDSNSSPYFCIVSVLMLREGWDVKNVTTIVPLRPYSSKANILPEQTLGRGLRRMTPPGGAAEIVTVVEHPAFARLNQIELEQEGLPIGVIDVDKIPKTTVSIFPDETKYNFNELDIELPVLTPAHVTKSFLDELTFREVQKQFKSLSVAPLPIERETETTLEYEGKNLITGETVEMMKVELPIFQNGIGAISFYISELETVCRVKGTHKLLAPLMKKFFEQLLFDKEISLFDEKLIFRLSKSDVREYVRAVFIPLIRRKTVTSVHERAVTTGKSISLWRPFQATVSERHPVVKAEKTVFNLVPCDRAFEEAFANWLDSCDEIASFAKNAGPQALRIDYLAVGSRLSFYKPDFFCRLGNGEILLVETKGRVDKEVPLKASAAIKWCEGATQSGVKWNYVYVPQGEFERFSGNSIVELKRACEPALQMLLETSVEDDMPLFTFASEEQERTVTTLQFIEQGKFDSLPERFQQAIREAEAYFSFASNKQGFNFAPAFTSLFGVMDEACRGVLIKHLQPEQPEDFAKSKQWFESIGVDSSKEKWLKNLKRTIVHQSGFSPIGLLRNCLDYALNERDSQLGGVFESLRKVFRVEGARKLLDTVTQINDFRNNYVAHQEKRLTDKELAEENLKVWLEGLAYIINK